ncbi:Hypothetical protein CAP_4650 [Chondromyces apiculatus DSM 436]|uniref:Uncharacterized protein n=1 Tax=Chondromyces apiculatus DSM 436 TaxID=1192034 RepID=A0A017T6U5_9BACT|nr:Hypothetical protein CAP_4650 [Chondromyces apiculatus DSM 436]
MLAVVCDGGACFVVPTSAPLPVTPRAVGVLAGPLAGAGGWGDRVYFVAQSGEVVLLERASGAVTRYNIGACRRWCPAARAPVSARIVPAGGMLSGSYRNDSVEIVDEACGAWLGKIEPETRDCFEVDRVALSADGETVALTGLDVHYTSVGDWGWGQQEVLVVAEVSSGRRVLDVVLGETMRPSEHEPIAVALGVRGCLVGTACLPVPPPGGDERLPHADRAPLDIEARFEDVTHLVALEEGNAALVRAEVQWPGGGKESARARRVASTRLRFLDAEGEEVARVELPAAITAVTQVGTQVGAALVVGCDDGRLVLVDHAVPLGPLP